MKEILEKLFLEQDLTAFEISEILKIDIENVKKLLIEFKINSAPRDRRYNIIVKTPFSKEQKSLIIGLLLGYSKIIDDKIVITSKFEDDLLWVKRRLGKFINVILLKNGLYSVSFSHQEIKSIKKLMYNNTKKEISDETLYHINELSLFAFFLQCGTYRYETIRFSAHMLSKKDVEIIQKAFKVNGINSKVCEYEWNKSKSYYLSLNKRNANIFIDLISRFLAEHDTAKTADIKSNHMLETPNVV